jgi:hypothetical protein
VKLSGIANVPPFEIGSGNADARLANFLNGITGHYCHWYKSVVGQNSAERKSVHRIAFEMNFFQHFARSPQTHMFEMAVLKPMRSTCSILAGIGPSCETFGRSASEGLLPLQNFPI